MGDHIVGENYNCKISATTTWTGVPTTAAGAGWDATNVETATDNQGFKKTTVTAEMSVDVS